MPRSASPENAILLGLDQKGGQLPAGKLPKPKGSDREKLLELLSSKALVLVDDGLVVLTATGKERVRAIQKEAEAVVQAKALKKRQAEEAKQRKAEAARQKKLEAAKKKREKAEAAAAKKALAAAEKKRIAAAKSAVAALTALLKDAKRITAKGVSQAERARRARALQASLDSEIGPTVADLVSALSVDESVVRPQPDDLRSRIQSTLRDLKKQVPLPELRILLGVTREQLHPVVLSMARDEEPSIDLEVAYNPAAIADRSEGIPSEGGLLYFISARR